MKCFFKVSKILVSALVVTIVDFIIAGCVAPSATTTVTATAVAPTSASPVPLLTPLTNSDSRVAELETKIRQLEAENQRLQAENQQVEAENQQLMTENQQISSDLAKLTSVLQNLQTLTTSSGYTQTISKLTEIQKDTNELAVFLEALPILPTPPPGLDISKVNDVIDTAIFLRTILKNLLPPPPFSPSVWYELDEMKGEFIEMTKWVEDLEELPEFLNIAGELDDVRYQEIDYLRNVNASTYDIIGILEQVRDATR